MDNWNTGEQVSFKVEDTYSQCCRALWERFRPGESVTDATRLFLPANLQPVSCLARGPNSVVYVAKPPGDDRRLVAVKVIDKRQIERLGGRLVKRYLPCQSIAPVHQTFQDANFHYYLTDYFPGGSLAKVLADQRAPLPEGRVRDIGKSMLGALNYLHSNKIAHRNLKLENILLDGQGQPVLVDYHYTIVVDNGDNHQQLLFTSLPYLAPEIVAKTPYNPMIADVWSFGVCLHIALNDCLPFESIDRLHSPVRFKAQLEPVLSVEVKDCIRNMLQCDVNRRPTTLALLKEPWFEK